MRKRHYSESPLKTAIQECAAHRDKIVPQSEIVVYNARSEGVNRGNSPGNLFSRDDKRRRDANGREERRKEGYGGERALVTLPLVRERVYIHSVHPVSGVVPRRRKKEADAKP